eukprot:15484061-Alexandrium_andersonii.AAC.1
MLGGTGYKEEEVLGAQQKLQCQVPEEKPPAVLEMQGRRGAGGEGALLIVQCCHLQAQYDILTKSTGRWVPADDMVDLS